MSFWDLTVDAASIALVTSQGEHSYQDLSRAVDAFVDALPHTRSRRLGFIFGDNSFGTVVAYLAALRGGDAACLLSPTIPAERKGALLGQYEPEWIYATQPETSFAGYRSVRATTVGATWVRVA